MLYPRESEFDSLIFAASAQTGVPVALLKAVFANESAFNPAAMGDKGRAYGIGQMWLATARDMGFTGAAPALLLPSVAIPLAARYLAVMLKKYRGDQAAALSAYNAGHSMIPAAGPQAIANSTNRDYLRRGLLHLAYFNGDISAAETADNLRRGLWLRAEQAAALVGRNPGKSLTGLAVFLVLGLGLFYYLTRR